MRQGKAKPYSIGILVMAVVFVFVVFLSCTQPLAFSGEAGNVRQPRNTGNAFFGFIDIAQADIAALYREAERTSQFYGPLRATQCFFIFLSLLFLLLNKYYKARTKRSAGVMSSIAGNLISCEISRSLGAHAPPSV